MLGKKVHDSFLDNFHRFPPIGRKGDTQIYEDNSEQITSNEKQSRSCDIAVTDFNNTELALKLFATVTSQLRMGGYR